MDFLGSPPPLEPPRTWRELWLDDSSRRYVLGATSSPVGLLASGYSRIAGCKLASQLCSPTGYCIDGEGRGRLILPAARHPLAAWRGLVRYVASALEALASLAGTPYLVDATILVDGRPAVYRAGLGYRYVEGAARLLESGRSVSTAVQPRLVLASYLAIALRRPGREYCVEHAEAIMIEGATRWLGLACTSPNCRICVEPTEGTLTVDHGAVVVLECSGRPSCLASTVITAAYEQLLGRGYEPPTSARLRLRLGPPSALPVAASVDGNDFTLLLWWLRFTPGVVHLQARGLRGSWNARSVSSEKWEQLEPASGLVAAPVGGLGAIWIRGERVRRSLI